jgi:hypothetical protein
MTTLPVGLWSLVVGDLGRRRLVVAQACEPEAVLPRMGPWKCSRDAEDHLAWP